MQRLDTVEDLRRWRRGRAGVALVPTMGALHEGHLTHVDLARDRGLDVVASVFVNPTQFGPDEDFDRYPRTLDADLAALAGRGAAAAFCPAVDAVYPPGLPEAAVDVPGLSAELEGEQRPGHFAGVCRVVTKLLGMARPDVVTLGRKDFQQLRVLQALIVDLALPVEVLEAPTVREPDGLAMSSRNRYLGPAARGTARGLSSALRACRATLEAERRVDAATLERGLHEAMASAGLGVDYAVVRDEAWLAPIDAATLDGPPAIAVAAARVEGVRLLDNLMLNRPDPEPPSRA